MKHFIMAMLLILPMSVAKAQNLVENGSFEEYTDCPVFGNWNYLLGWDSPHTHSADYFHACAPPGATGFVPFSAMGYQHPAHGEGYVGMVTSAFESAPWYREFMGTHLIEPLQPGVPVCLSFQMAVGGFGSWFGNSAMYTCKGVGLKFFVDLPMDWQTYLYPNSAALYLDEVPTDTAIWYGVSGTYVPDSAYTYLIVGNFFADSLNEVTVLDSTGFGVMDVSYAFIDDVRVSFDLSYCTSSTGSEERYGRLIRLHPNPFVDRLHCTLSDGTVGELSLSLFDAAGRRVLHQGHGAGGRDLVLNTEGIASGTYLLHIQDAHGTYTPKRVMKISP